MVANMPKQKIFDRVIACLCDVHHYFEMTEHRAEAVMGNVSTVIKRIMKVLMYRNINFNMSAQQKVLGSCGVCVCVCQLW